MKDKIAQRLRSEANDIRTGERALRELNRRKWGRRHHIALLLPGVERAFYLGECASSRLPVTLEIFESNAHGRGTGLCRDDGLGGAVDKGGANNHALGRQTRHRHQRIFDERYLDDDVVRYLGQLARLAVNIVGSDRRDGYADRKRKLAGDLLESFPGVGVRGIGAGRARERDSVSEPRRSSVADLLEVDALQIDVHSALR